MENKVHHLGTSSMNLLTYSCKLIPSNRTKNLNDNTKQPIKNDCSHN